LHSLRVSRGFDILARAAGIKQPVKLAIAALVTAEYNCLNDVAGKSGSSPSPEEKMMARISQTRGNQLIFLILFAVWCSACAGGQTTQQVVVTEYLLKDAGFKPYEVNDETPKRQALVNSLPPGKISTFIADGTVYHIYVDEKSPTLYIGDAAAYQKYLSMAQGKQLCERVDATASAPFWSCFDDFQKSGAPQGR
jgi:hypothetical protein